MSDWRVIHGDALEVLRGMEAGCVDAVVTDPPYGERAAAWDIPRSRAWYIEWIGAVDRLLSSRGVLIAFGGRRAFDLIAGAVREVRGDSPVRPLQMGVWVHRQGHAIADGMLRPEHEPWVASGRLRATDDEVRRTRQYLSPHNIARKSTHRRDSSRGFNEFVFTPHAQGPMGGTVIESARNKPAESVGHPTQKPEAVMEQLVLLASCPGDLVLDPFAGSGTVGVVALRHGRRFVGIDLSADYCAMARRRIAGPLFAEHAP